MILRYEQYERLILTKRKLKATLFWHLIGALFLHYDILCVPM